MPKPSSPIPIRRIAAETALLVGAGVFMAFLSPFGTDERPILVRIAYWPTVIVGGGVIGIGIDVLAGRRLGGFWPRLLGDSLLMTAPVTALVYAVSWGLLGPQSAQPHIASLLVQVFVVSFGIMLLRQFAWRGAWNPRAKATAQEEAIDPSSAFRQRLSAKHRSARLIAVEAEDHYLRVHTDAGDELVTARFSDALLELATLAGYQTHRSWWVAAGAIEAVRWRRGRGELRLTGGLTVPVSRTYSAVLKREGWF